MNEEILDMSTIVVRKNVRLRWSKHPDGKLYQLADVSDLGIVEHARIVAASASVDELNQVKIKKGKLTPAQERAKKASLRDVVKLLLPTVEPKALTELSDGQCEMIITAWSHETATKGTNATPQVRRSTTARSSRRSSGSTAATRKAGSTSRRG